MDLVREIFKQKIAAFLLYLKKKAYPEHKPKPLSTGVGNKSTSVVSTSNPEKGKERWGRGAGMGTEC